MLGRMGPQVHEAFLRLAPSGPEPADEARFYHSAAQAMRRILIEHARKRGALKRGAGRRREDAIHTVLDLARDDQIEDALALDEGILRLESEDREAADVVRLRFFAGVTSDHAARILGISPRQADRAGAFARAFLLRELRAGDQGVLRLLPVPVADPRLPQPSSRCRAGRVVLG
jgi:RNA polymerase sigma factor (TIGR02999 family)